MADNIPKTPKELKDQVGVSGTLIYSGIITSEDYNANLKGTQGNKKYEIMRRSDSTVRGALQVVKLPLLSTTWDIDPAQLEDGTVSDDAKKKAAFVKRELMQRNINWNNFIREALTFFDFGFSVFEKVYELTTDEDGNTRIGLAGLQSRKQVSITKWCMEGESSDGLSVGTGITQMVGSFKASIPFEKLVVFTHDKEGDNYEGISLLRYVYKDWDMKDKLTLVNAMALEKLGVGVPVVQENPNSPDTATPTDQDQAVEALSNLRANEKSYLKIPKTMTVEMLDLKGNTTKEVIPTLNYHDARIMKSILAGFLELGGASGSGSQSLSKDLTSLFYKSEEAAANMIIGAMMESVIKQLCDLNWSDMSEGYPKLTFGQMADDDNIAIATALGTLMQNGAITPDAEIEDHLRGLYRLPLMSKEKKASYDEDHVTPPAPNPNAPAPAPAVDPKADVNATIQASRDIRTRLTNLLGASMEG